MGDALPGARLLIDWMSSNRGAAALLTSLGALAPQHRNLIWLTFLDPPFRSQYADWPRLAQECAAVLRMEAGRHPGDPALTALAGELSVHDPDFRTWWASHPVRGPDHRLDEVLSCEDMWQRTRYPSL